MFSILDILKMSILKNLILESLKNFNVLACATKMYEFLIHFFELLKFVEFSRNF